MQSDEPILAEMRCDFGLQHMLMAYPDLVPDPDVSKWIDRRQSQGELFVIAVNEDCPVGFVQLHGIHKKGRFASLALAIHPNYRGKGFGKLALKILMRHSFSELGLLKLMLEVRTDNTAAISIYKQLNFREVGTLKQHYHEGERSLDVLIMECVLEPS